MIIKDENHNAKQAFKNAVEKKRLMDNKIREYANQMQESYQHWLWKYLEIEEARDK